MGRGRAQEPTGVAGNVVPVITACAIAEAGDSAITARGSTVTADISEFRMVENIEGFGAEFEGDALVDGETFKQRHVKIGLARIADDVPGRGTESQPSRSGERERI